MSHCQFLINISSSSTSSSSLPTMIALPTPPPPLFPNWVWSFESGDDQHHHPFVNHQESNYFSMCSATPYDHNTTQTFLLADSNDHLSTSLDLLRQIGASDSGSNANNRTMGVKKLHHNASERDRRKKMNTLYSSLRSLLPVSDQMKKMSIPSTVARVVKYIPELQQEVQKLIRQKERLLSKMGKQQVHNTSHNGENQTRKDVASISLNQLGNGEIVIQIPAQKGKDPPLMSELLLNLKELEHGLLLLNASSFQSAGSTLLFYNLHFQVKEGYKVDCEDLNKKLISLLDNKEMVFPANQLMQPHV